MRNEQTSESDFNPELSEGLKSFVNQLAGFKASPVKVDRDQVLFEAGKAAAFAEMILREHSMRRSLRLWQTAAASLLCLSAGLGGMIGFRTDHQQPPVVAQLHQDHSTPLPDGVPRDQPAIQMSAPGMPVQVEQFSHASESRSASSPLRIRQELMEDSYLAVSNVDQRVVSQNSAKTVAQLRPQEPELSTRLLLQGERVRGFIHHLIEESSL